MPDGSQLLRSVAWREVCPWLVLFRVFRLAISTPILFVATLGALLTPLGWNLAELLFVGEVGPGVESTAELELNAQWPDRAGALRPNLFSDRFPHVSQLAAAASAVPAPYLRFVRPFAELGDRQISAWMVAYFLFGGIWNVLIWGICGGIITRLAAIRLGREEQSSLTGAVRHTFKNALWYWASPFFPLLGVFILAIPLALLGLLMRFAAGALVGALLWPFVLLIAFVMTLLLLGTLLGWPLMWPTISCEESSDAFEAFSRSFSYTFQRPIQYLGLAILTVAIGALGWTIVSEFALAVIRVAEGAVIWGSGSNRWVELLSEEAGGLDRFAAAIVTAFNSFVLAVAAAFNYAFFFCSATAIYLLLRRQVDQTEMDEVFSEEDDQRFGLPDVREASTPVDGNEHENVGS